MGKIYKLSGYLVDFDNESDKDLSGVMPSLIAQKMMMHPRHFHIEESDCGYVDSNHELNDMNVDLALCEKYFKSNPSSDTGRTVEVGRKYRHFKNGKIVKVIAVSQDTENIGSYYVIYECMDEDNKTKIWNRPYGMFLSEVDHKKYPDATQKYRFELVE